MGGRERHHQRHQCGHLRSECHCESRPDRYFLVPGSRFSFGERRQLQRWFRQCLLRQRRCMGGADQHHQWYGQWQVQPRCRLHPRADRHFPVSRQSLSFFLLSIGKVGGICPRFLQTLHRKCGVLGEGITSKENLSMKNGLISLIFLMGAAMIACRVLKKKIPRVCMAYAAGIAIIAGLALITGRTLPVCATAPLFALVSVAQRKEK